jgi:hypothetical protein
MHPIEVKQECIEKAYKESEILKLLQNLDVNKSFGPDGLHPKMLKELSATISTLWFNCEYATEETSQDFRFFLICCRFPFFPFF